MKRVRVELYGVREESIGQSHLPPASSPRLFENRFVADFLPKHSAKGHIRFRATEPGSYLIRLDSEETINEHGHEHFAALDLKVE
jgi:hypothetical protein